MSADKPYDLTMENREGFLFAHVKCDTISRQIALDYLSEVVKKCRELKQKRLLLYRDIPAVLSDAEVFQTAKDFIVLIRGIKTSVVNPYITHEEAMRFAVTVSTNRGANYMVFNDAKKAEAWLLKDFNSGHYAANPSKSDNINGE